jgi:hypothetical protein
MLRETTKEHGPRMTGVSAGILGAWLWAVRAAPAIRCSS